MSTKQIQLIKYSPLHWEIVFNRPEKLNAITNDMYERVTQIVNEASKDEQLVLLTITGNGKFYSAGTDLTEPIKMLSSTTENISPYNRVKDYIDSFINCSKIIIAFVNGPAHGISVTTLALFDGVYASSNSTFTLPFVRLALSLEGCSSMTFPSLMGSLQAKEALLLGRTLTAEEAERRGLITRIFDEKVFEQEKQKICTEILSLPKGSLLTSKNLIQRWNRDTLRKVNEEEMKVLKERVTSEEFAEAIMTFMNRKTKSKL